MSFAKKIFGKDGEDAAVRFLKNKKYRIIEKNFNARIGEIDIICAAPDKTLVFVEVKARHSEDYGVPEDAVTPVKQRQIAKAAVSYLKKHSVRDIDIRFDVLSILFSDAPTPEITHIENAFEVSGYMI